MGRIEMINPHGWPRPRGYSHGAVTAGSRIVWVAGQLGRDRRTGQLTEGFASQWDKALENLATVIEAAGASPSDIVFLRIYVTDLEAYRGSGRDRGASYAKYIGKHFPPMTMVQVSALTDSSAVVEIEGIAVVDDDAMT